MPSSGEKYIIVVAQKDGSVENPTSEDLYQTGTLATVMKTFDAPQIDMPYALKIEKLENRRNTTFIWATKDGLLSVDDRIIGINNLIGIMYNKISKNPKITVSLKSDQKTKMKLITDIHSQLREANALKLSYSALTKK